MVKSYSNEFAAVMKTRCVAHAQIFHYGSFQLKLEGTAKRKLCDGPNAAASCFHQCLAYAIR